MSIYEDILKLPHFDRRAAIGLIGEAVEAECRGCRPRVVDITAIASMLTAVAILGATDDPRETEADIAIRARILHTFHIDPTNGG